ncbi:MAG: DUF885 domain-containing protein [Clostridiales bacterium]|jgi:uncharacterized protein (DUF885 family)|nr:DUF885 domain-containing protein [Clostridiales bacterium]
MLSRKIKQFIILGVISLIISLCGGCDQPSIRESQQNLFDNFIIELFVEEVQSDTLSLNYTIAHPEKYGIVHTEATLGEYTINYMKEQLMTSEMHLNELKQFDYNELTADQQLIYDILMNYLESELELGKYLYYIDSLKPTTGLQAQLPILLAEYNFYEKGDIDRYLDLLVCVKDYFEDVGEFEREKSKRGLFMTDAVVDRIIEQCEAFIENPDENLLIEYFDEKINHFEGLSDSEKKEYREENRKRVLSYIIPAYEGLIEVLSELKGTGTNEAGLYYYPEGQAYYECLFRIKTGSDKSMKNIANMLETAIGDGIFSLTKQTLSNPMIFEKFESFTSFPLTDPVEIIEDLKKEILDDFPEPIDVNYEIKYVHESLSDYLSPALYLIPAIDNYTENNIYINGNDLETLSRIYTTVAHEGYPGHLYQNVYFRSKEPAPIRSLLTFTGYDEGWATYVEFYSYQLSGIDEDLANLLVSNNEIVLLMYARADIGIHYEGWDKTKALSYIGQLVGDEDIALKIYDTLLEEPAIYLPYAVGYLEIMELRNMAMKAKGDDFDIKEFHKFLLDIGPAQFFVIKDRMESWLNSDNLVQNNASD